jgi:hypothetical protein
MPNANAATALTNKLLQVLTGGGGVAPNSFVSIAAPGLPVDLDRLKWATQPAPYVGNQDADDAEAFATQVNTIPTGVGPWTPGTADMARTYRDLFLQNCALPSVTLNAPQEAELGAAHDRIATLNADYIKYQGDWQNANMALQMAVLAPRDSSYFQNLLVARQAATNALSDWQARGHKAAYETAVATVNHYEGLGLVNAKNRLIGDYDSVRNLNSTSTAQSFVPVSLYPNTLFKDSAKWNTFSVKTSEFASFQHNSSTAHSSGSNNWLFWSWGSANSGWSNSQSFGIDSSDLTVSFEYLRVHVDRRSWFDSALLMSNSWWWPGATKADPTFGGMTFSDGNRPELNAGRWQMIPTEILLTRNLVVDAGSYDMQSQSWASGWTSSSRSGFWIFHTGGTTSSGLSSGSAYHSTLTRNVLKAPQPQIAAFVCQLMPKEPNPSISLLP